MIDAVAGPHPVVACVKWVDLSPEVDLATGVPVPSRHSWGFSEADRSALEVSLELAGMRRTEAVVVCFGPPDAAATLGDLAAVGADRAVLVAQEQNATTHGGPPSTTTARVLADVVGPVGLDAATIVCGDMSSDRGSGSVPALLAHHLRLPQALGLISIHPTANGSTCTGVRRLDGARRERVEIPGEAVISVEGAVAELRRAPLTRTLDAPDRVQVLETPHRSDSIQPARIVPWRPSPRSLPAPQGDDAFERVLGLTGALDQRTPPRIVELAPQDAAHEILEQLRRWGYRTRSETGDGVS